MRQLILYIIFLFSMVFAGYGEVSVASVSYTSDALPKKDKLAKVEYDQHQGDAQLESASELAYRICSSRPQRLLPSGNMQGNQSASRLLSHKFHLLFTLLSAIDGAMEPFRHETAPIHFDVASKYYVICLRRLLC